MNEQIILFPRCICQTKGGDLAHTVGRLLFRPGQPMLVEHLGGIYLEHDLTGEVLTAGYDDHYAIVQVHEDLI